MDKRTNKRTEGQMSGGKDGQMNGRMDNGEMEEACLGTVMRYLSVMSEKKSLQLLFRINSSEK